MTQDLYVVPSDGTLHAVVARRGAQLVSLRTPGGVELLWGGHAAWPWHAPLLFPIIGRVERDVVVHEGREYPMPQHGIARRCDFVASAEGLVLVDDEQTRRAYPFAFRLVVTHRIRAGELIVTARVENPGPEPLPFALGVHPAFCWPLPGAGGTDGHRLVFEHPEPAPVRRVTDVLLRRDRYPTPVTGRTLELTPAVFADGAVILDEPVSRRVVLAAPGAPRVHVELLQGFDRIAMWSPVDPGLMCIEPWSGLPAPHGSSAEFSGQPGLQVLDAGGAALFRYAIGVADTCIGPCA